MAVAAAHCRNCHVPLAGPYCAACGQRDVPPNPTFGEFAADAWDALVSVDGKLFNSVRLVLARPGELTRRYLAGHRAPYLPPLRLYLACSLAFFVLEAAVPEGRRAVRVHAGGVSGPRNALGQDDASANVAGPEWARRIQRGRRRAGADEAAFSDLLLTQAPKVVFALVPVHALLLAAVYRSRRLRLPAHLVFALHAHAFVFCVLCATAAVSAALPGTRHDVADVLLFVALAVYFPVAMRRVYGGRWAPTLARAAAVVTGYGVGMVVVFGVLIVGTLYVTGASAARQPAPPFTRPAPPGAPAPLRPPSPSATP